MSLFASLGATDDVDDSLWGDGGLFSNNPVQDILDREEGFTLEELLEEDELIQEVKHLNTKLISFLSQRDTVQKLVEFVTRDDTKDEEDVLAAATKAEQEGGGSGSVVQGENSSAAEADEGSSSIMSGMPQSVLVVLHEREKLGRFAYTASEIFCCEVPGVNCHLIEDAQTVLRRTEEGGDGSCETLPEQLPGGESGGGGGDGAFSVNEAETKGAAGAGAGVGAGGAGAESGEGDGDGTSEDSSISSEKKKKEQATAPLISIFFQILSRNIISPRTAGYFEKIIDVLLGR